MRYHVKYALLFIGIKIIVMPVVLRNRIVMQNDRSWRRDSNVAALAKDLDGEDKGLLSNQTTVIDQRLDAVRRVCASPRVSGAMSSLTSTGSAWTVNDVTYCVVPKAGSTFWKQVMRYVSNDVMDFAVSHPSDIDRYFTHYGPTENINVTSTENLSNKDGLNPKKMFMFARNPYTRLWSSFIEKFILPDFWISHAIDIAIFMRPSTNYTDVKCVSDITFSEFLAYITYMPIEQTDEHWRPIYRICNPCQVNFDIIGKHETFRKDTEIISKKFNVAFQQKPRNYSLKEAVVTRLSLKSIDNLYTGDFIYARSRDVDMILKYNFDLYDYRRELYKDCFDWLHLERRLWFALQASGYIHMNQTFPELYLIKNRFHGNPSRYSRKLLE